MNYLDFLKVFSVTRIWVNKTTNYGLTCVEHLVRGDVRYLNVVGQQPEENGLKRGKNFVEKINKYLCFTIWQILNKNF
jgi:hypothetical protein